MSDVAIRFGEADLTTCDREPIHIPGSIQPHGVLLVVDRQSLAIEQAAGNTSRCLGVDAEGAIGLPVPATAASRRPRRSFARNWRATSAFVAPIMRLASARAQASSPLDLTIARDGPHRHHRARAGTSHDDERRRPDRAAEDADGRGATYRQAWTNVARRPPWRCAPPPASIARWCIVSCRTAAASSPRKMPVAGLESFPRIALPGIGHSQAGAGAVSAQLAARDSHHRLHGRAAAAASESAHAPSRST